VKGPLAILLAFCVGGCIFSALALPGRPLTVDARVLGKWQCMAPDNDSIGKLTLTSIPDGRVRAEFTDAPGDPTVFEAYAVAFEGSVLVNAELIADGERRQWTVARYTLYRPNLLHIESLRYDALRGTPDSDRSAALRTLLAADRAFDDYCTCLRVESK
jgi:hypothetical protein